MNYISLEDLQNAVMGNTPRPKKRSGLFPDWMNESRWASTMQMLNQQKTLFIAFPSFETAEQISGGRVFPVSFFLFGGNADLFAELLSSMNCFKPIREFCHASQTHIMYTVATDNLMTYDQAVEVVELLIKQLESLPEENRPSVKRLELFYEDLHIKFKPCEFESFFEFIQEDESYPEFFKGMSLENVALRGHQNILSRTLQKEGFSPFEASSDQASG